MCAMSALPPKADICTARISLARRFRVNLSEHGASLSIAMHAAGLTTEAGGLQTTVRIPGTGASWFEALECRRGYQRPLHKKTKQLCRARKLAWHLLFSLAPVFQLRDCTLARKTPMHRIITLSLPALFIISGAGAALSNSDTFNGIRDGAAITPSDGFVARAEKSATETRSNMRGGTSNKLTMVGSGDDATPVNRQSSRRCLGDATEANELTKQLGTSETSESSEETSPEPKRQENRRRSELPSRSSD
jgi:hypothetical protein